MTKKRWTMREEEYRFVVAAEGRKPNVKILYGDNGHNIPHYGTKDEARITAIIIEHALNGIHLINPKDKAFEMDAAIAAWIECPKERRPSPEALGKRVAEIAAEFIF